MSAKQILVVEDDPRVSAALAARLRSAGYEVLAAPEPHVGANLALFRQPDLIITDILMPTLDGLSFVRALKDMGFGDVPFIVMTASYQDGLWESAMELGATAYFEKPFDGAKLLVAVDEALKRMNPTSTDRSKR